MYSLRKKLGRNLLLSMLVIMAALLLAMNLVIRSLVNDYVASRMEHDIDTLVSALQLDDAGRWVLDPGLLSSVYQRVRSGHYFVIETPTGGIRSRSLFDIEPAFEAITGTVPVEVDGPGRELWLVMHRQVVKQGQSLKLWLAEDIHQLHDQLLMWSVLMLLLVLAAMLLLMVLQYRLLSRGFHIFDRIRHSLKTRRYQPLDIDADEIPREITPLLDEIALLIEQLRQRTQRTRNALGDLAHELKRPLQVLALATERQDRDPAERQAVQQLRQLIDRELKRARISGSEAVGQHFDPNQDLPPLLEVMQRIHPGVRFRLEMGESLGDLPLDRDDLLELIGNLLDNAGKFARSEARLDLQRGEQELRVSVDDDGPGLPGSQVQEVLRQGVRLDETREGQGLGLRICKDIVDSYQGRMELGASPLGGLGIRVHIPLPVS